MLFTKGKAFKLWQWHYLLTYHGPGHLSYVCPALVPQGEDHAHNLLTYHGPGHLSYVWPALVPQGEDHALAPAGLLKHSHLHIPFTLRVASDSCKTCFLSSNLKFTYDRIPFPDFVFYC